MTDKEKNFVSAVIYVHNAENRIRDFLCAVIEVLEENFEHSEIICVNDGSEDGSPQAIKEASAAAERTSVSILDMSGFHGIEKAMRAGVDLAIGDLVFEFDHTYLDHDRSVIMDVYRRALQGYDIVRAVPDRKERFSSRMFYTIFYKAADLPYRMHTESFHIMSRRMLNRIGSMNRTVPYRKVAYAASGLKSDTVIYGTLPVDMEKDRTEGRYRAGLAMDALILFTGVGFKFSVVMTVVMMLISLSMTIYSIAVFAMSHPVAGWTTTVLFLSVAFFGLFGVLAVIIKYLQLLVDLVFKKKQYSFEDIEKLTR